MNLDLHEGIELASEILNNLSGEDQKADVILIPPFIHLSEILKVIKDSTLRLGAQNAHAQASGAFTGEVSAKMLASVGVDYCLVGHSERRIYQKEKGQELSQKVKRLIAEEIRPIFCVGESLEERESGKEQEVISHQLNELFQLSEQAFSKLIIAYEPVWAIGTGKTASAEQAQEMHAFIRAEVAKQYQKALADQLIILYGGSCNPQNASELFSKMDVDGGLIGGASLKADSFTDLIKIANDLS